MEPPVQEERKRSTENTSEDKDQNDENSSQPTGGEQRRIIRDLPTSVDEAYQVIHSLDDEYASLTEEEIRLNGMLKRLQSDEVMLQKALTAAKETGATRRERQIQEKDAEAVGRLQDALMGDDSSSDEDTRSRYGESDSKSVSFFSVGATSSFGMSSLLDKSSSS